MYFNLPNMQYVLGYVTTTKITVKRPIKLQSTNYDYKNSLQRPTAKGRPVTPTKDQISFDFVENCCMLESVESSYTEKNNRSKRKISLVILTVLKMTNYFVILSKCISQSDDLSFVKLTLKTCQYEYVHLVNIMNLFTESIIRLSNFTRVTF
jgi:hypothetical protein